MAMPKPPPPGVSAIGETGSRTPVASQKKTAANQNRVNKARRESGTDRKTILEGANVRRIQSTGPIPPGSGRVQSEIIEVDLSPAARQGKGWAVWNSIDGNTYRIQYLDTSQRPPKLMPGTGAHMCSWAIREQRLGGDPLTVFEAFKLKLKDSDGQIGYPFPEGIVAPPMGTFSDDPSEFTAEEMLEQGFGVGEAE
jgi:hypothetical protein